MPRSGEYSRNYIWWIRSAIQEQTIGAQKEAWTTNGNLWGHYQPIKAYQQLAYAAKGNIVDAVVKVHQYQVQLKAEDRLEDTETGDVWLITGCYSDKPNNEVVCECKRFEQTTTSSSTTATPEGG